MQKLKEIPELIFRGMNDREKPEYLKEGYLAKARNCLLGDNQIEKGPGNTRLFNIPTDKKILGGIATDSEIYIAANEPGDTLAFIYRYTGSGNPIVVSGANLTADTKVEFIDAENAVYVLNGTDATGKLVGDTYTQPAGMQIGSFGEWYNNRFYILTTDSVLYYSEADDPEDFDSGDNNINIFQSQRGVSTGIKSIGGVLVIGKRDNIITFNGFTEDDFTAKKLTETLPNYGVTSNRSMVNTGDDLYFMSFAGDVPHIRSLVRTSFDKLNFGGTVSGAIEGTMRNLNKNRLDQVAGGFDGRYMWWSVPYKTSSTNDLVICKDTFEREADDGWTIHDSINASVFFRSTITGNDRLYFGDEAETKVYEINHNISARESGTYDFIAESRKYRPYNHRKSKFKYVYLSTDSDTTASINVGGSPEGFTYETQATVDPDPDSSVFPMTFPFKLGTSLDKERRINLSGNTNAYTYQLKYTETSNETSISTFPLVFPFAFGLSTELILKEWSVMYYPRGLRDAR